MIRFRNVRGGNRLDYLVLTKVNGAILGPISQILGWILNVLFEFTSSFGVLNIGLSIILFTLVVKIIMFPLTIKQQKSSKLLAVMQPDVGRYPVAVVKEFHGVTSYSGLYLFANQIIRN